MSDTTAPALERGVWSLVASPVLAQRLSHAGFDWMCLDAQHGGWDRASLLEAMRGARGPARVMVRVGRLDPAAIGAALDAGAAGVIVPMIEDAADAAAAARAGRYPPRGDRSWGPIAPSWGAQAPSADEADRRARIWTMIETRGGLDAIEAIAAVDGVDGLFVGPFDLALALGVDVDALIADTAPDAPLRRIVRVGRAAGLELGVFAGTTARAAEFAALGFDRIAVATDLGLLDVGTAAALGGAGGAGGY